MKNAFVILIALVALVSCQFPLNPAGSNRDTASGTVQIAFASASRTVVADWNAAITSYKVTLTSQDGSPTREATATPGSNASFTGVDPGTWDVGVSALNGTTVVGAGSLSDQELTAGGSLSLTVPVSVTQTGTGGFAFRFTVPSSTNVRYVTAQLYHPTTGATVGDPIVPTLSASGSNHQGTVERTGIPSGSYRLGLTLHWGSTSYSAVAARVSEAINVWDNVTSDQWLDSSGTLNAQRAFGAAEFHLGLAGEVSTLAGAAEQNGSTDGTGAAARFYGPYGVATDGTNAYVADSKNNAIRKIVIATGEVTTFAGSTQEGSADGIGTAAQFNHPYGVATDGTNLYVADSRNRTIRKIVIATAEVTTLAGAAEQSGTTDGTGSAARFGLPWGVATDGTNVYVADSANNAIRKIVIATGVVTTLAGSTQEGSADGTGTAAQFNYPVGVATDGTNLYVGDSYNNMIRRIVIATGVVTTLAGSTASGYADGTGAAARFDWPWGVATDGTHLYVADVNNVMIRKVVIATGVVTTLAGSYATGSTDGTGAAARFGSPAGVALNATDPASVLLVADHSNSLIRMIR